MVGTNTATSLASGSLSAAESLNSTLALPKNFDVHNLCVKVMAYVYMKIILIESCMWLPVECFLIMLSATLVDKLSTQLCHFKLFSSFSFS